MSRADGVLRVVLTGKWFDMIERGEKVEEYRKDSNTWCSRLLTQKGWEILRTGRPEEDLEWLEWSEFAPGYHFVSGACHFRKFHTLVASRGYTSRTLTRKIKRIRWGAPRPEWSGDTVTGDCFIIELEAPE